MTAYSNPRMQVTIPDWPSGKRRVVANFWVEIHPKRGQRACRETDGRTPKKLTYAERVRFVDGDDGRLYVIEHTARYSFVSVMKGTFDYQHETIHKDDERYDALVALLGS